jgi:hypothetical protein
VTTPTPPPPKTRTTHSPGPWRIHSQSESGRYITVKAANGRTVARVPFNPENTPLPECTDARDALVISLLPEMLAALQDVVTLAIKLGNLAGGTDTSADLVTVRRVRDLIAKARGHE